MATPSRVLRGFFLCGCIASQGVAVAAATAAFLSGRGIFEAPVWRCDRPLSPLPGEHKEVATTGTATGGGGGRGGRRAGRGAGRGRARSHCRFARPLIRFIPGSLTHSVPLSLRRQSDRALGAGRDRGRADRAGRDWLRDVLPPSLPVARLRRPGGAARGRGSFPLLHRTLSYYAGGCMASCMRDRIVRYFPLPTGVLHRAARPRARRLRARFGPTRVVKCP